MKVKKKAEPDTQVHSSSGYGRNRPHRVGSKKSGSPWKFLLLLIIPPIPFFFYVSIGLEFDPLLYLGPILIASFIVLVVIIRSTNLIKMKVKKKAEPDTQVHSSSENPIEVEQTTNYNSSPDAESCSNALKEIDLETQSYIRPSPMKCQNCNSALLKTDLFCFECGEKRQP